MVTQVETRSPGEETSGIPIAVSTATANSATLPVKKEKPDSPPPQRDVAPIHRPSPLPLLDYLSQNQAYINVRTTRKSIARPQCSICLKTFSRSGTLKVILFKLLRFAVENLTCRTGKVFGGKLFWLRIIRGISKLNEVHPKPPENSRG